MKETLAIVEFPSRFQLLQATIFLPEELGLTTDYFQGTAAFYAKKGRRILLYPVCNFKSLTMINLGDFIQVAIL